MPQRTGELAAACHCFKSTPLCVLLLLVLLVLDYNTDVYYVWHAPALKLGLLRQHALLDKRVLAPPVIHLEQLLVVLRRFHKLTLLRMPPCRIDVLLARSAKSGQYSNSVSTSAPLMHADCWAARGGAAYLAVDCSTVTVD